MRCMFAHIIVKGFNATIFAYGQTGSGKTFTMFGPDDYVPNPHVSPPSAVVMMMLVVVVVVVAAAVVVVVVVLSCWRWW